MDTARRNLVTSVLPSFVFGHQAKKIKLCTAYAQIATMHRFKVGKITTDSLKSLIQLCE